MDYLLRNSNPDLIGGAGETAEKKKNRDCHKNLFHRTPPIVYFVRKVSKPIELTKLNRHGVGRVDRAVAKLCQAMEKYVDEQIEIWIGVLQHASIEKCIEDSIADAYRFNVCG